MFPPRARRAYGYVQSAFAGSPRSKTPVVGTHDGVREQQAQKILRRALFHAYTNNMVESLTHTGLKVAAYKCFGDLPQGFEQILPFNIIVGRNNTGKSALLDVIAYVVTRQNKEMLLLDDNAATVVLSGSVTQSDVDHVVGKWGDPRRIIGRRIEWSLRHEGRQELKYIDETGLNENLAGLWSAVAQGKPNPFRGYRFKRLRAERDVQQEDRALVASRLVVDEHGGGATRLIHRFRSSASMDSLLVEQEMLRDLNTIFGPDATFTRLDTREADDKWEIWLDEAHKGRVPLSRSGSGLKTIILMLVYLHLIPRIENADPASYIYGFEELENNLHPAIQRRLLHFLRETSDRVGCYFFRTTHSPVEIDYFARDERAQILHVAHDGVNASVATLSSHGHRRQVLDDIDLRASDILQSNGIIWVEGPSDRIYLNRWVELWSNGRYREGAHYQILFYGGRLLAHLDAEDPKITTATIHLLTTNRNVAIIIDSDQTGPDAAINATKARLVGECERAGSLAWVTAGREIENYLPPRLVATLGISLGRYQRITDALLGSDAHNASYLDKVTLARHLVPQFTRDDLTATLDLATRLEALLGCVRRWNGDSSAA